MNLNPVCFGSLVTCDRRAATAFAQHFISIYQSFIYKYNSDDDPENKIDIGAPVASCHSIEDEYSVYVEELQANLFFFELCSSS